MAHTAVLAVAGHSASAALPVVEAPGRMGHPCRCPRLFGPPGRPSPKGGLDKSSPDYFRTIF
eukprot:8466457-Pyramimonas_sp.AAC.1